MAKLWEAAFGVAGLAGVVAFVFWSLFRGWLKLPGLGAKLTKAQVYRLFQMFLILTFLFAIAGLATYVIASQVHASGAEVEREKTAYVSFLRDRFDAGKRIIAERRRFLTNAIKQGELSDADRRKQAADAAILGKKISTIEEDNLPPPSYNEATPKHLEALGRFEDQYVRIFETALEAATNGNFTRCHDLLKDIHDLADTSDAKFAFSHTLVTFVHRGMVSSFWSKDFRQKNDWDTLKFLGDIPSVETFKTPATQSTQGS